MFFSPLATRIRARRKSEILIHVGRALLRAPVFLPRNLSLRPSLKDCCVKQGYPTSGQQGNVAPFFSKHAARLPRPRAWHEQPGPLPLCHPTPFSPGSGQKLEAGGKKGNLPVSVQEQWLVAGQEPTGHQLDSPAVKDLSSPGWYGIRVPEALGNVCTCGLSLFLSVLGAPCWETRFFLPVCIPTLYRVEVVPRRGTEHDPCSFAGASPEIRGKP